MTILEKHRYRTAYSVHIQKFALRAVLTADPKAKPSTLAPLRALGDAARLGGRWALTVGIPDFLSFFLSL
jgi:hypothetical protein